jgi:hypothetical protein
MILRESQIAGTSATHRQAQPPCQEAGSTLIPLVHHTYQCRSVASAIRDKQLKYERQTHHNAAYVSHHILNLCMCE